MPQLQITLGITFAWWTRPIMVAGIVVCKVFPSAAPRFTDLIMSGARVKVV